MKLRITGASHFVNRMFEACGSFQWAREFLRNSLDAGATRVEFGIEWQAVEKCGVYRRTIVDNGCGMDRDDLLRFFSTLGEGARKIGGIHDNFGVGAKIASLPWNPEGVVVVSYKSGQASMIWIVLDSDSGDYELVEFEVDGQKTCIIEPTVVDDVDWAAIRPDWLQSNGTIVVLLGSEEYPDTVLGSPQPEEKAIKGLSVYLNSRFWDLSDIDIKVVELRSEKKSQWPQSPSDKDDSRRPNNREIMGARYYLTDVRAPSGKPRGDDVLLLDGDRVSAEWYLWEGERPAIHSYAKKGGYIAVRYQGELFHITSTKAHYRWFGVVESKVQQNLTIILEPQHYQSNGIRWGIHPDQSRNRLIFTGNGEKGVELPFADWGLQFAEAMPPLILEAIREARGDLSGSIEDEEYRRRLQDKFGSRWTTRVLVKAVTERQGRQPVSPVDEEIEAFPEHDGPGVRTLRKHRRTVKVVRKRATPGGPEGGVELNAPVDVPRFRFAHAGEFEMPWHLALWAPNDPDGPTVLINVDSSILQEVVDHHQEQYPDVYSEEIAKTVRQVFGEIATCKVAHSQKLRKLIPEEELDREYRSEQALTVALMGLMAEETVIAQRLVKLGRKRNAGALLAAAAGSGEAVSVVEPEAA